MFGKLRTLISAALIAACVLSMFALPARAADKEKVVIDGSTTVGPIAKAFAGYYMQKNADVNVTVSESGSGNGAKSLINGACDIAAMSRFMKDNEFEAAVEKGVHPVAHAVAMDGIAVIVHPANPVKELSVKQARDIYKGKITNWKQLGGPDMRIVNVSRDTNSGTYETFHKLVMKKERMTKGTEYVNSNGAARARVINTKAAIAYVGLGFTDGVKALKIGGIMPTKASVASGRYPISRPLFMFTDGYPKLGSHVHAFVTLHLTPVGQQIIEGIGYVPVTRYKTEKAEK